jgi:Fur family transcriptional regulator, ferric uptake regulator
MKNHKCCGAHLDESSANTILSEHGMNRTKVKTKLLIELSRAQSPSSVADLHAKLGENCAISTIFRTIAQFKEKNLVHETNLGEGFFRYQLISPNQDQHHHHHHVRCRNCGDIKLLDQCDLSLFEKMISKLGFQNLQHHLEFTAICTKCS